jgi:hypothetical protein
MRDLVRLSRFLAPDQMSKNKINFKSNKYGTAITRATSNFRQKKVMFGKFFYNYKKRIFNINKY